MAKQNYPGASWRLHTAFAAIVLLVIAVDQASKCWIASNLAVGEVLLENWLFQIIRVSNTGAAFGIFQDGRVFLIIVDFIAIAAIGYLVFFLRKRWPFVDLWPVRAGIALVLGGTIGNLIDRLFIGYVTDFVDLRFWPVWNVADASVVVGVIILIYCLIFLSGWWKGEA